jgi:predicted NBD/HSP70 family sugar kinase
MSRIVGVDLGGTWLRIGVVELEADDPVIDVKKIPSSESLEQLQAALEPYAKSGIDGFGIAVSGPVADHATLIRAPNLPWLNGRNLSGDLRRSLGKPVVLSNDMEAAAEGEMARGALRRFRWAIFDTISTGWGGNLVLNGMRVDGEPGHANVSFDVPERCGAGHVGCRESLYSGSALENKIRKRIARTGEPGSDAWAYLRGEIEIADPWALALLDEWAEGVGRAWANTLNRIRPLEGIVYMGTTAENLLADPRVAERLRQTIQTIAMFPEHQDPEFPIVPAEYADRALYGAALIHQKWI